MKRDKHMILATVRMAIPPQKRDEALKILGLTAEECRFWPNCLSCRIYEDTQEHCVLMFEERWGSHEDLERHLRSDEYYKVLLVMEMALEQPEIRFDTISGSTGIETVEKARNSIGR
jgi:quinol monooxygenase YgiN